MYSKMPLIWFKPMEDYKRDPDDYPCPCYKTGKRAGVLSTSGTSTNFVVAVELPTDKDSDYWVLRGAALLCALDEA